MRRFLPRSITLRALFVVLALIGVVMGLISHEAHRARRIDRAVADLIDSGSQVGYTWEYSELEWSFDGCAFVGARYSSFAYLEKWNAQPNLAGVFGDAFLSDVLFLNTRDCEIDARWRDNFEKISKLEQLTLTRCDLTTISWHDSPNLPNLRSLTIDRCKIPASFDQLLKRCPNLEYFKADDTRLESDQIQTICSHPNLRHLDLSGQVIPEEALHSLSRAENLEVLILDNTNVGDEVLELVSLPQLMTLSIHRTNLSNVGVDELPNRNSKVRVSYHWPEYGTLQDPFDF